MMSVWFMRRADDKTPVAVKTSGQLKLWSKLFGPNETFASTSNSTGMMAALGFYFVGLPKTSLVLPRR